MQSIIFPNNITSIGKYCFRSNFYLSSIDIPDSVILIDDNAFSECLNLKEINISPNSNLTTLGINIFRDTIVKSIFLSKNVTNISPITFDSCILESITVDQNNPIFHSDSKSVFKGTENSTLYKVVQTFSGEYIVPLFVTSISDMCFDSCLKISNIALHNNITSLGFFGFYHCQAIKTINIPKSVIKIEEGTFLACNSLTSITIPENVILIDSRAFKDCRNLKSITFLSNNNEISFGDQTFRDIENPMNIYIPGKFNAKLQYQNLFPNRSHLYITSQTKLSYDCKKFF